MGIVWQTACTDVHTHTLFNDHMQDLEQFTIFTSCVSSPMILQQYCTPHDAPPYVTCEHKWIKYSHYTHPPQPTWRTHWVHSCVWARGTLCWCSRRTAPALQMCRTWCLSSPAPSCHGQPAPWPRGTFCSIPGQHQSSLVGSLPALCTPWSQCHLGSPPAGMWSWTSVGRLGRTPLFLCRLPRPETHRDRTGYHGHTGWGGEQVAKAIWLGCMTEYTFLCKALSSLCLAQSLSLWHQCAKSLSWQLIQARVRPNTVSSTPLPTSVSGYITSFPPFICDHIMWLSIISWKTMQKTQTRFLCSRDDSAEPVPSTSSKLVNNRPPTQETLLYSTNQPGICEYQWKGQDLIRYCVKHVDCYGVSQAQGPKM